MVEVLKVIAPTLIGCLFVFAQYMITRKDNKDDRVKKLEERIEEVNNEREDVGFNRYREHKEAIEEIREILKILAETNAEQSKIIEANSELVVGMAQDRLFYSTKKYQMRNAITLDELAILEAIYDPYHNKLNGNGRGKTGVEYCRKLPVVDNETAFMLDEENKRYEPSVS